MFILIMVSYKWIFELLVGQPSHLFAFSLEITNTDKFCYSTSFHISDLFFSTALRATCIIRTGTRRKWWETRLISAVWMDVASVSTYIVSKSNGMKGAFRMALVTRVPASHRRRWRVMVSEILSCILIAVLISGMSCWRILTSQLDPELLLVRGLDPRQCHRQKEGCVSMTNVA